MALKLKASLIAVSAAISLAPAAVPAHADLAGDSVDAINDDTAANLTAVLANATSSAPITCQFAHKTGGPLVNPGVNAADVQCFSFGQKNYSATLRISLERKTATGWTAFDILTTPAYAAVNGALVIPQTLNDHIYGSIPDPNIGTAGSVHHGKFSLTLSTGQLVPIEYTNIPWTMAPW